MTKIAAGSGPVSQRNGSLDLEPYQNVTEGVSDIPAGDEKLVNLFLRCSSGDYEWQGGNLVPITSKNWASVGLRYADAPAENTWIIFQAPSGQPSVR